jgi:single-strand DNA-binding protein
MRGLNKAMLLGYVGKDPELRYTSSGTAVASFSLATNESWKDKEGERQERTEWHNCTAWGKLAEIVGEYVKKGSKLYVEGKIQTESYEKDGVKKYTTKIVVAQLLMLDSKESGSDESTSDPEPEPKASAKGKTGKKSTPKDDDLPF